MLKTPVLCVLHSLLEGRLQRKACYVQSASDDIVTAEGMSILFLRTTVFARIVFLWSLLTFRLLLP